MHRRPDTDPDAMLAALGAPAADRDYRPGHARVHALLKQARPRRPKLRIRVAGTNGKGSTAIMVAAGLRAAGLRVGLYTSPHILRFNERIRVNGTPVGDAALRRWLERLLPSARRLGASYFETATVMALACFSEAGVDAEVLEAGVGARLDATTAVDADMALITPIGLDHQDWLGDTLPAIAAEKAHVMNGCRFALGAPQPPEVRAVLHRHRPDITFVDAPWQGAMAMVGAHQRINAALAIAALRALIKDGWLDADEPALADAVAGARAPGRLQCVHWNNHRIWLDAAHNRHAIEALLPWLKTQPPFDAIFLFTREDRNLAECASLLAPHAKRLHHGHNAETAGDLAAGIIRAHPPGRFLALGSFRTVASLAGAFGLNLG